MSADSQSSENSSDDTKAAKEENQTLSADEA